MMWRSQVASTLIGLCLIFQMERFEKFNNVAKLIFSMFVTVNLFRLRETRDIKIPFLWAFTKCLETMN